VSMNPAKVIARLGPMWTGLLVGCGSLLFVAIVFNIQSHGWIAWYQLAAHGRLREATVSKTDPQDHNTCFFEYVVDSIKYRSSDQGCEFEVGQRVTVTYLPTEPSFATTASPAAHLASSIGLPFVLCALAGIGTAQRVRRQRLAKGPPRGS